MFEFRLGSRLDLEAVAPEPRDAVDLDRLFKAVMQLANELDGKLVELFLICCMACQVSDDTLLPCIFWILSHVFRGQTGFVELLKPSEDQSDWRLGRVFTWWDWKSHVRRQPRCL